MESLAPLLNLLSFFCVCVFFVCLRKAQFIAHSKVTVITFFLSSKCRKQFTHNSLSPFLIPEKCQKKIPQKQKQKKITHKTSMKTVSKIIFCFYEYLFKM